VEANSTRGQGSRRAVAPSDDDDDDDCLPGTFYVKAIAQRLRLILLMGPN
jgi:hypothetical protein